ncbi:hypothetical protein ATANTOWER_025228 [Ataeniobius toweri]|uniref:Uncharacterized protein n=1 Tax=Ataeniobius toweri TaxID=208326 RepID=A0ABU7B1V0_9TELE|nr:hypothetical protein [Ataeniobius toweri]
MRSTPAPHSGQKNIPLKPRKQARISAVLKSAKFSFDGSTSSPASRSRANSPTPGTYGEGRSTQNRPSVSCPVPDRTQQKPSHYRIKGFDLVWLLEVKISPWIYKTEIGN